MKEIKSNQVSKTVASALVISGLAATNSLFAAEIEVAKKVSDDNKQGFSKVFAEENKTISFESVSVIQDELAEELVSQGFNIDNINVNLKVEQNGKISEFTFNTKDSDQDESKILLESATKILEKQGVKIPTLNHDLNPAAVNVLYKDGGWVLNFLTAGNRFSQLVHERK